ncbi:MAG: chromosomal replication initiator protein DnaA [Ruthenibacterium sp.]
MNSFDEVFAAVKDYCKERLAPAAYNLFIDGIAPVSFDDNIVSLSIHSEFLKGLVEARYCNLLKEGFKELLGFAVEIDLKVTQADEPVVSQTDAGSVVFTFDNFIVGSTNKFAHAAAQAVAANPSGAYNPLFIWGDSGLGKTHLLCAIQAEIRKSFPNYNIVYITCEKFTNEIITGIHDNTMPELRARYRAADVLLVDDIQFIGGKVSTQEEFFHTFNTLYNAGKQIVLASDRPPKEIKSLDERLRTRFEMGLIADIQPPDFETRAAIIRRKADLIDLDLPDETAEYIANRVKSNIRQLEGVVKKLNAQRILQGIQPTIAAAQNAIKDILSETQPVPVTVEKILSEVARTYNTTIEMLRGPTRSANVSAARKVSMYIIREITGLSMEDIGREFGNRDHSTVVYSINNVQKNLDTDRRMRETTEDIIKNIRSS